MKPTFEIKNVVREGQRAYVRAKRLTPTDFAISSVGSTLGGCRLKSLESGSSDEVFTFMLESPGDASRLVPGSVVELSG